MVELTIKVLLILFHHFYDVTIKRIWASVILQPLFEIIHPIICFYLVGLFGDLGLQIVSSQLVEYIGDT